MAFKRYIYKHGKKLGPYYYENVRDKNGNVKTIYLGTNPNHHPKHHIRKPLFFLIIVLVLILILGGALFFLQNKAYLIKKVRLQEPNFEIDQILLKILIRSDEFLEKQVRVMNTGSDESIINVEVQGLFDIVKIDSNSFTIKPGQTKILGLNFSSFVPEQKIEHQHGVYVGKLIVISEKASREVPIVVEIETKNVLFDMNLNPVAIERKVKQGSDTTIEVRLFNLQSIESANVDVEYFVKDMNGNTILTESETVVVKTQASFFKTISIPRNLKPGPYVFAARVKFGNSIGTASYLFDVIGSESEEASFVQFCKNNVLCLGMSITTILLLFALTAYFYFFIGAYLYEKVTGIVTLPKRKKEERETEAEEEVFEKPEVSIFDSAKEMLKEVRAGTKLKRFYRILDVSKKSIEGKDISKLKKLYVKARDFYVGLSQQERKEVYGKLRELHNQINLLEEEKESLEGLKTQKELEKQRKKEDAKRRQDLLKKQKELEKQRFEEERKKREAELKRQREFGAKQREEERLKKELERERLLKERKKKVKEFFHKIGLYKTPEEKAQIILQKEKERQEKERIKQEKLRRKEEIKQQKEIERKQKEIEEKKAGLFERVFRKKEHELEEIKEDLKEEEPILEKKPTILERLFGKKEAQEPISEKIEAVSEEVEKKPKKSKPASEAEELEDAIKSLGLFKEMEKGKLKISKKKPGIFERLLKKEEKSTPIKEEKIVPEKKFFEKEVVKAKEKVKGEKPKIKLTGKSKAFGKCYKALHEAKESISKDNAAKAKKLYLEARNLYMSLEYHEKKEVYGELMDLYNSLK